MNSKISILFDDLSVTLLITVNLVSLLILVYSYNYMIFDPHIIRFFSYIILFVFFMIILITSSNLVLLFIGWEGIGLCSFLLISYYFTRLETNIGALLAIIMNRIGDIFFLLAIFGGSMIFNSLDILTINCISNNKNWDIFILFLFIAGMAKSAQIYLHNWLVFSMEGPTPISSLIHAATLVTAGVFLLLRLSILLSYSYITLILCLIIGVLTSFLGRLFSFNCSRYERINSLFYYKSIRLFIYYFRYKIF